MWFLIKGTFWFAMVLVVLSYFGVPEDKQIAAAPAIEVGGAIAAATDAYSYISAICIEKPDVCIKGAETIAALGQRAKAGALVAYQILDEKLSDGKAGDATLAAAERMATDKTDEILSDIIVTGTVGHKREPLTLTVPVPLPKPAL